MCLKVLPAERCVRLARVGEQQQPSAARPRGGPRVAAVGHVEWVQFARVAHITPTQVDTMYFAGRSDGMRAEIATHLISAAV